MHLIFGHVAASGEDDINERIRDSVEFLFIDFFFIQFLLDSNFFSDWNFQLPDNVWQWY